MSSTEGQFGPAPTQDQPQPAQPEAPVFGQQVPPPSATAATPADPYGGAPGQDYVQQVDPMSAQAWKRPAEEFDLTVPSGNVCKVRSSGGMAMFMQKGMIPNSLMPIIKEHMNDSRELQATAGDVLENPELLENMMELADNVVMHVVVLPEIQPIPMVPGEGGEMVVVPQEARNPAILYVDEVDMNDKMFIFQWAMGGTKDVERFREEQKASLEDLSAVQTVELPS